MIIKAKIPATSANIAPCFDCAGMAHALYNEIVLEPSDKLRFLSDSKGKIEEFFEDENGLITKSYNLFYEKTGKEKRPFSVSVRTVIPPARGLGSSASLIVGTLACLNEYEENPLEISDLISLAAIVETHPDNTTPAFTGGFVVSSLENGEVDFAKFNLPENFKTSLIIPDFELKTSESRAVLPEKVDFKDAVFNLKKSAMLVASIVNKDFALLKKSLDDRLHQPYRSKLIPGMNEIFLKINENPSSACFLSGAGPTLAVFSCDDKINLESVVSDVWDKQNISFKIMTLGVDNHGLTISTA